MRDGVNTPNLTRQEVVFIITCLCCIGIGILIGTVIHRVPLITKPITFGKIISFAAATLGTVGALATVSLLWGRYAILLPIKESVQESEGQSYGERDLAFEEGSGSGSMDDLELEFK